MGAAKPNPASVAVGARSFRVPSTDFARFKKDGKTAVVIGAGPAGLTAALTVKETGYDNVVVFEKRLFFSRNNVVNLHPESQHIFKRLGILERFLSRASPIVDHVNYIFSEGEELFRYRDPSTDVEVNPDHPFDADDVLNGFKNETAYSITLADLQDLLAAVACERGIMVVSGAEARFVAGDDGVHSVRADLAEGPLSFHVNRPMLVIVADGAAGTTCRQLGGRYVPGSSLWPEERWIFGNVTCRPEFGYSHLLLEFAADLDDLTISNCIFLPRLGEVNVAVTVKTSSLAPEQIGEIVATQGRKVVRVSGVAGTDERVTWHSNHVVHITPNSADRSHFGKNVVVLGDAMGANSPVAALGGTLSTSAYAYAIRRLALDLEIMPADDALARYAHRTRAYVTRWHHKVGEVRRLLESEIRKKSTQLVERSHGRSTSKEAST